MLKPLIAWLRGEPLGKKVEGASQKVGQGSKEAANKTSVDKTGDQDLRYFPNSSWPGGPDFHVRVMKVWPVTLVKYQQLGGEDLSNFHRFSFHRHREVKDKESHKTALS